MEQAPAGVPLTFEVTYQASDLDVGMSVYDTSGESPELVQGPSAMTNVSGTNTYIGTFTAQNNKTYLILKAVYTDDTYATVDTSYGQGSESIVTDNTGGGGANANCTLIGIVSGGPTLVGVMEC